jgi:hypothetical protein
MKTDSETVATVNEGEPTLEDRDFDDEMAEGGEEGPPEDRDDEAAGRAAGADVDPASPERSSPLASRASG